jgi:hypothetical protein
MIERRSVFGSSSCRELERGIREQTKAREPLDQRSQKLSATRSLRAKSGHGTPCLYHLFTIERQAATQSRERDLSSGD